MKKKEKNKIERVAFFGSSATRPEEPLYQSAKKVARLVAQAGYTVVNGGGPGVMQASSEGAKEVGGKTIGVTFYPKDMPNFEGRSPQNLIDSEIKTDNYLERTLKLIEIGQIFIIFNGGTGTLSEFGMSWGLARLYYGHHKPLILYGGFWYPIMEAIAKNFRLREEELRVYRIVDEPERVVPTIEEFEKIFKIHYHRGPFQL